MMMQNSLQKKKIYNCLKPHSRIFKLALSQYSKFDSISPLLWRHFDHGSKYTVFTVYSGIALVNNDVFDCKWHEKGALIASDPGP